MNFAKNRLTLALTIVMISFLTLACSDSDDHDPVENQPKNIVEIASENKDFSTLVAALTAAGLDDDLAGPGPFTVFAPTNDAFDLLPEGTLDFLLDPANQAVLIDILTYHVIDGEVFSAEAITLDGTSAVMFNGENVRIDVVDDALVLNMNGNRMATVTTADIEASNGVIHVIDAVLDPEDAVEDIVATAIDNGNFTTLVTAVQAADLVDDLQGPGPLTVFAPTDDAFAKLPEGTVETLLDPANQQVLIDILTYHVYDGSVLASAALTLDGQSVTMLNGDDLSFDIAGSDLILNLGGNRQATVTVTDVLCSNGVIHVIDTVLDPADAP
jgi:transforming growth factor-beta-induced protein